MYTPPALGNWKPHAILFPSPFAVKSPAAGDGKSAGKMASPPASSRSGVMEGLRQGPHASRSRGSQLPRAWRRNGSAAAGEGWPPQSCTPVAVAAGVGGCRGGRRERRPRRSHGRRHRAPNRAPPRRARFKDGPTRLHPAFVLEEGRRRGHRELEVRTLARLARLAPHAGPPALPTGRGGEEGRAGEQRLRRPWSRSSAGRPPRPEQRSRRRR